MATLEPLMRRVKPEEILLPVKPWWIALSLVVTFVFNLFPWPDMVLLIRPDFFALTLLYWCIREPRFVGIGIAWLCGIVVDVVEGNTMGQHALAYSILAFAADYFRRRVLRFALWNQALHALALLLIAQAVIVATRLMSGAAMPNLTVWFAAISGALAWPLVSVILQWPQRKRESEE
jgi:rod shape-determining protein MreD